MVQHFLSLSAASDFRRNRSVSSSRNNNQPGGRSFFWLTIPCRCFVSYLAAFVAGFLTTILVQQSTAIYQRSAGFHSAADGAGAGNDCVISLGRYQGPQYVHPTQTVQGRGRCLVESKFLKVQQHSVQFPPSNAITDEKSPPRIDDWIWIDYHDRINVLIEVAAPTASHDSTHPNQQPLQPRHNAEPHFFMFQQTK